MSQENVDTVRRALEYFAATDDFLDVVTPDFVWDLSTFRGWPDKSVYEGREGIREFLTRWRAPYDDWAMTVEDVLEAGENRVVSLVHYRARLRGSDAEVELRYAGIHLFEGDRVRRTQLYASPEEAFEAAGLRA